MFPDVGSVSLFTCASLGTGPTTSRLKFELNKMVETRLQEPNEDMSECCNLARSIIDAALQKQA